MTRNRITLATAVALSMSLAGCTPARFDPNAPANNPAAANPATTTTPGGNNSTGGMTTPGGTTTTPAATTPFRVAGLAELSSGPMKNASIRVEDAVTGRALGIVAAGAGNIVASGAGNYGLTQTHDAITADENGVFIADITGLPAGGVARIIATTPDGKTLTSLAAATGESLSDNVDAKTYVLLAQASACWSNPASCNTSSLINNTQRQNSNSNNVIADNNIKQNTAKNNNPTLNIPGGNTLGNPNPRIEGITDDTVVFKVTASTTAVEAALKTNLKLQAQVTNLKTKLAAIVREGAKADKQVQAVLDADPRLKANIESGGNSTAIQQALVTSGVQEELKNQFLSIAQQFVQEFPNLSLKDLFSPTDLAAIKLGVDAGGNITDDKGTTIIEASKVKDPTQDLTTSIDGANDKSAALNKDAALDAPVFSCGCFTPRVKLYYIDSTLTINVSQGAGEADIGEIVARFPGTGIFTGAAQNTISTTGRTDDPLASGVGSLNLTVDRETDLTAFPNPSRAVKWGGAQFDKTKAVWSGYLKNGGTQVAYFQVFEDTSANYTYVATTYKLTDGVKTNSGHSTRLETIYLILEASQNADVFMRSRNGDEAYYKNKLNTSGLQAFPTL